MHAWQAQRLMSNQIIIRKTKAEEKEQGFEYKMFRLTSEITSKRKFWTFITPNTFQYVDISYCKGD